MRGAGILAVGCLAVVLCRVLIARSNRLSPRMRGARLLGWVATLMMLGGWLLFAAALRPWLTFLAELPLPQRILYLLVPSVLLGLVRFFGLGLASLFVYSVWWPDPAVLLWFVLPLLVAAVLSLVFAGILNLVFAAEDFRSDSRLWSRLIELFGILYLGWAAFALAKGDVGPALVALLAWIPWAYERWFGASLPAPWRVQVQRREVGRLLLCLYVALTPFGAAVMTGLSRLARPGWLIVLIPALALGCWLVMLLAQPRPHQAALPRLVPGGQRVFNVMIYAGLTPALLALSHPDESASSGVLVAAACLGVC